MHEWALAESIVMATVEEARKEKLKTITQVTVYIGELQQIEKEIFLFALNELSKSQKPPIKKDAFVLKTDKSTLTCKNCGETLEIQRHEKETQQNRSRIDPFHPGDRIRPCPMPPLWEP